MLRIISANLNGIRSAVKKGFLPWVAKQKADFICMQELKAQQDDLEDAILNPDGLYGFFHRILFILRIKRFFLLLQSNKNQ